MFNITSGNIRAGVLYMVYGTQSVTYNSSIYASGHTFRGIASVITYTFSGTGTQLVYEVEEIEGATLTFEDDAIFDDISILKGSAIEYMQDAEDLIFNDVTVLNGFVIELIDYPFYSFAITETRL